MRRYPPPFWWLAAALACLAGYVDAIGFLRLGGLFVSFMTGNTTRMGIGLAEDAPIAGMAAAIVASFIAGVALGALLAPRAGLRRKPIVLLAVALLLALAAVAQTAGLPAATPLLLAAAMGVENNVFARDGEVSVGVTYMTGTLVKLGQALAGALLGGPRFGWLPYLMLWSGLLAGAVLGAVTHRWSGAWDVPIAAGAALLLAGWAARLARTYHRALDPRGA